MARSSWEVAPEQTRKRSDGPKRPEWLAWGRSRRQSQQQSPRCLGRRLGHRGKMLRRSGFEAFVWDATTGSSLRQVLVSQFGLGDSLRGWKLQAATAVSADGSVVVGYGMNPHGNREAWLAYLGDEHRPLALAAAKPAIAGTRSHE